MWGCGGGILLIPQTCFKAEKHAGNCKWEKTTTRRQAGGKSVLGKTARSQSATLISIALLPSWSEQAACFARLQARLSPVIASGGNPEVAKYDLTQVEGGGGEMIWLATIY